MGGEAKGMPSTSTVVLRCAVVPHTYRTCPTGRHLLALIIDTSNFELVWFELDDGTYQIE